MSTIDLQGLLSRAQALEPAAQYDAALADLETVLSRAGQEGRVDFQATAQYQKGRILRIKGELATAETSARQAAALFSQVGDLAGQAQAMLLLGEIFSDQPRLGDFEQVCREALALSRRSASPSVEARSLTLLGTARMMQGEAEDARAHIEQAVGMYRQLGERRGLATGLLMLGRVDHMGGRLAAATESIEAALPIFEETGERRATTAACFNLGQIDLERGALDQARHFAQRGLSLTEGVGDLPMRLRSLLLLAQIDVESARFDESLLLLRDVESLDTASELRSILPEIYRVMAQACLGRGDVGAAERYVRSAREIVAEDDPYSQGTTQLVLALVLERQGRVDEADNEFRGALAQLEEAEETFEIGWGHLSYAQFLLSQGRRDTAREHLTQARAAFVALEARNKIELIDGLLGPLA